MSLAQHFFTALEEPIQAIAFIQLRRPLKRLVLRSVSCRRVQNPLRVCIEPYLKALQTVLAKDDDETEVAVAVAVVVHGLGSGPAGPGPIDEEAFLWHRLLARLTCATRPEEQGDDWIQSGPLPGQAALRVIQGRQGQGMHAGTTEAVRHHSLTGDPCAEVYSLYDRNCLAGRLEEAVDLTQMANGRQGSKSTCVQRLQECHC
mmetsp:Transcript_62692/g.149568  ORF Transcript_62692/g.149568 Transcript_62692/m.149568 type:complete len:203 (+) Transcript_62692:542-1150(+)